MKSSRQIYMDYQQALRKAEELENIADSMKSLASKELQDTLQNVSASWKSVNASNYLEKGEKLGDNITRTAKQIDQVASTIRSVAKRTYEAEMRAYRIAKARKYKN